MIDNLVAVCGQRQTGGSGGRRWACLNQLPSNRTSVVLLCWRCTTVSRLRRLSTSTARWATVSLLAVAVLV